SPLTSASWYRILLAQIAGIIYLTGALIEQVMQSYCLRLRSSLLYKLEVDYIRGGDGADELETVQVVANAFEEPLSAAEQDGHEADLHFADQAGCQVLACDPGSSGQGDVFAVGGQPRLLERGLDSVGDEVKGRSSFHLERFTSVMCDHEHRMMEGGSCSPPAFPGLFGIPRAGVAAEHVAPHHRGADVHKRFLDDTGAFVDLSALHAVGRSPHREGDDPFVKVLAADAEGILQTLIGSGHKAVE